MSTMYGLSLIKFMSLGIVDKGVLLRHINKSVDFRGTHAFSEGDKSTVFRLIEISRPGVSA